jgi:lambda repressor-like predicted transcriptional regulator
MATLDCEIQKLTLLQAAKFLHAYLECSDEIQAGIREMLKVLDDPNTDEDDRDMTLITLADALFPNPHEGKLGMDLEESERLGAGYSDEMRATLEEMDKEEDTFAAKLRAAMENRKMTQGQLAEKIGTGQPAISNMLNRQCRPQRRTVRRLAEALDVVPEELWPGFRD